MLKKSNKKEASPFQRQGGGMVAWWLTPRTPDPGSPCCVLEIRHIYPPKVLVIHRKRWLRPNMTEKLFTRMLSIKPNQNQILFDESDFFFLLRPVHFLFSFHRAMLFILANQEMCIFFKQNQIIKWSGLKRMYNLCISESEIGNKWQPQIGNR